MKKVLVLGAGLVSRPLVRYLLERAGLAVTVASRTVSKAVALIDGHERGAALPLDVKDEAELDRLVGETDLAISLLPYVHHVTVARLCLKHRIPMVTTSYVSDAMRELDAEARAAGVILLNEIGVDPGIDHMAAMQIIHRVQNAGGTVARFHSYCGGLPAPEANTNPYGYKFSWSPRGVLMAGRNSARYLEEGAEVNIPGPELFANQWELEVPGAGTFEAYPNRDSIPYIETYGLKGVKNMLRGTLRYPGWCETLKAIADLGLLEDETTKPYAGLTLGAWLGGFLGEDAGDDPRAAAAAKLGLGADHGVFDKLDWLGLFSDEPVKAAAGTALDVLCAEMLARMSYAEGERDLLVQHHEFDADYPDGRKEAITSTMVDFGIPHGDSSMARTVSLPAAIGARLILEGRIPLTGVQIPVQPEIYTPVLEELATMDIEFAEAISRR